VKPGLAVRTHFLWPMAVAGEEPLFEALAGGGNLDRKAAEPASPKRWRNLLAWERFRGGEWREAL